MSEGTLSEADRFLRKHAVTGHVVAQLFSWTFPFRFDLFGGAYRKWIRGTAATCAQRWIVVIVVVVCSIVGALPMVQSIKERKAISFYD